MPGLTLIGPIAARTQIAAPDEIAKGAESYGIFVVGDVRAVGHYSGTEIGPRWLVRAHGPLAELVQSWPTPDGETSGYFATEEEARRFYGALRGHAPTVAPDLRFVDTRAQHPLNAPGAVSESVFQGETEVLRLILDRMTDLQVVVRNTDAIWTFPAHPAQRDDATLVAYHTQSDVLRVAYAAGPSGAAEHLCVVYSKEPPERVIAEGMQRATEIEDHTRDPFTVPSNIAVLFWGRAAGKDVLAPARGGDPAAALHGYLGDRIAAPLATNLEDVDRRLGGIPAAWVIRMEPGRYEARYYELDARPGGGHSFLAISRMGAASFQPLSAEGGGRVISGMTIDQYAMMSAERDMILMQQGGNAGPALAALCQRYGQDVPEAPGGGVNLGYAARVTEWDLAIQGNSALSAQWVSQLGLARMKLQGVQVSPEQLAQMAQQQQVVQQQLQQHAQAHADATKQVSQGANQVIELARTAPKEQLVSTAQRLAPNGRASDVLYEAVRILKNPDTKGAPRYGFVDLVAEKVVSAHWASMSPEDQKFEGGKEKSYVKEQVAEIYEANGLEAPNKGFFSKLIDKL
jgi:hypothetical protein